MFAEKHHSRLKTLCFRGAFTGVAAFGSALACAQPTPAPVPYTAPIPLSQLLPGGQEAGGIIIGDKVFTDFSYQGNTPSGNLTNPAPTAANIQVGETPGLDPSSEGLRFSAPWQSTNGQNQDSVISFVVHTLSGADTIDAIGLKFNGAAVGTGAAATVTESAYQAMLNPTTGQYQSGPELSGTVQHVTTMNSPISVYNDGTNASYDSNQNLLTLSNDQSAVYVSKDIQVFSPIPLPPSNNGTGASTISWVDNIFHQTPVPEPATASLLAVGAFGMLARRRRA